MTAFNEHIPTNKLRTRVKDLATAGIPLHLIAKVVELDEDTVKKHYSRQLECAQPEAVERIGKVVAMQAEAGCPKAQSLYLKTQGAKFGWVEKQVVESVNAEDTQALKDKIKELEQQYERDY